MAETFERFWEVDETAAESEMDEGREI